MSISALEAELRDGVMEVLDAIAGDFGAFQLAFQKLAELLFAGTVAPQQGPAFAGAEAKIAYIQLRVLQRPDLQ